MLRDPVPMVLGRVLWFHVPEQVEAGREQAPLLLSSTLRFPGVGAHSTLPILCLSGNQVPQALHHGGRSHLPEAPQNALDSDSSLLMPQLALTPPSLLIWLGCATTVLVTGAGIGEMVLQMLVGLVGGVLWGR